MSRTVIGYQDGHPIYRDDGPAYARRQGFGGSAIGHFSGTTFTRPPRASAGTVDPAAAASHRSAAQQRAVERKRAYRARARAASPHDHPQRSIEGSVRL